MELTLGNARVVFIYIILLNYTSTFTNLVFPSSLCKYDFIKYFPISIYILFTVC